MKKVVLGLLRCYQRFISPALPPSCRFYPTCSTYAYQAVSEYGVLRGGFLALKRIFKCHPFHPGGYDPVPLAKKKDHCSADDSDTVALSPPQEKPSSPVSSDPSSREEKQSKKTGTMKKIGKDETPSYLSSIFTVDKSKRNSCNKC